MVKLTELMERTRDATAWGAIDFLTSQLISPAVVVSLPRPGHKAPRYISLGALRAELQCSTTPARLIRIRFYGGPHSNLYVWGTLQTLLVDKLLLNATDELLQKLDHWFPLEPLDLFALTGAI
jgi:hypothetical protein